MRWCTLISISLILVLALLLGLVLLIPFPLAIFPSIVKSQVYIQQKSDGELPKATYFWSKLPAIQYYDFYFFNITNPDEVLNNGEMACLVEVGPYSYAETEFKEEITFYDNDNMVFYRNNKTWVFNPDSSCPTCTYDDVLTLPNAAYTTLLYTQKSQGLTGFPVVLMDLFLLLLGESPIRTVPMAGVLFEGYPDPLTDFINSNFTKIVLQIVNANISIPNVPAMGYFPLYNHTSDGSYYSKTGKDDTNNLGLIQKWVNSSQVPWWGDEYSRDISGSGDGSFQKPMLKKSDTLKQFQSFICRSFYLHYEEETKVNGIPAYRFAMNSDTYDTTTEKNKGYRYENVEKANYWPSWPCGLNHTYNPKGAGCNKIDCTQRQYFCNSCCDGSHVNGTYAMPEGIIPLRCLPGQLVDLPFAGFLSPPHFLWSPEVVQQSMYGLNPDESKHFPGVFDIQPTTGSTVNAAFRMQLSVPVYSDKEYTELSNIQSVFFPSFWLNLRIEMRDYATDYIKFNTVTLPHIILGVGIGLVALSCLLLVALIVFIIFQRRRSASQKLKDYKTRVIKTERDNTVVSTVSSGGIWN